MAAAIAMMAQNIHSTCAYINNTTSLADEQSRKGWRVFNLFERGPSKVSLNWGRAHWEITLKATISAHRSISGD